MYLGRFRSFVCLFVCLEDKFKVHSIFLSVSLFFTNLSISTEGGREKGKEMGEM